MLNVFVMLSLSSFIICLVLGLVVYTKYVRHMFDNHLAKLYVLICFTLAFCWALIELGYRSAPNFEIAFFWIKINMFWYIVLSLLLHFTLIYTENFELLKRKITYLFIYGPAFAFILLDVHTTTLLTEPVKVEWGWIFGIPKHPIMYGISLTWAAFTVLFCLYIYLDYLKHITSERKKICTKYTIIGMLIPIGVGLNTEWLLPIMNVKVPELVVPTLTLGLVIIWYVNWYYLPKINRKAYQTTKFEIDRRFIKEI